ncbi:uncharacterized protein EKO05_0001768 [Ascochyta rabiei]|uniref:Sequence-specific DNA binding RNA polymerase II transcription factor n=1 Tax=Didymella rabiei TaxID=5454 RepID=A0A163BHR4_DIDRA|nr:uncharacterized protein EKO05_0001768 [Ascochyta rabiei]KZM21777.1 sequence-specific DNA binding RNA polymerase II transcription factor [Ascochyta rabiei]UPX11146.1 hypothetical protein EKO05_0001768 [Ascochyta rabiei]
MSRSAALKLKNDRIQDDLSNTMELYWYLQTQSRENAAKALELIQSGLKPARVLQQVHPGPTNKSPEEQPAESEGEPTVDQSSNSATIPASTPANTSANVIAGTIASTTESTSKERSSPEFEPLQQSAFHPSNVIPVLTRGVESFLLCTGCIFHIYDASDAQAKLNVARAFIEKVGETWAQPSYGSPLIDESRVILTPVCIMAALGLQYTKYPIPALGIRPSSEDGTHRYVTIFYEIAKRYLDVLIERNVLEAMRACAAFCVFNTIGHATVALNYAYMGINVAFNNGLPLLLDSCGIETKDWPSYKRVLRTLGTLHDWLVSTLGFVPQDLFGAQAKTSTLLDQEPATPAEIIQQKLAKVVHIEADLLRSVASFETITSPFFAYVRRDLLQWYEELPVWMRLDSLVVAESRPSSTIRTIYLVHLFYLSANILVARLAHKQLCSYSTPGRSAEMRIAVGDGLVAARTAARILQLQLDDLTIYQRCWCCEFAAYMACLTLLHSTTQLVLNGYSQPTWQKELSYAKSCIDVLEYCALVDKIARNFLKVTIRYYNVLLAIAEPNVAASDGTPPDGFDHLFSTSESTYAHLVSASAGLVNLLSHPFGSPSDLMMENTLEAKVGLGCELGQDSLSTPPQNTTLNASSDRVLSLRKVMSTSLQNSCLLGSSQPHDWSPLLDMGSL